MPQNFHPKPGLRQRLALMLLVVAVLAIANIVLFERLNSRNEASASTLAKHVELYKLTQRILGSIHPTAPTGQSALYLFNLNAEEFERDITRFNQFDLTANLPVTGNPELALLVEQLTADWRILRTVYHDLRKTSNSSNINELIIALDHAAAELKASIIAINFLIQNERAVQFSQFQKTILYIAAIDLVILVMIMLWLQRRVVTPIEQITAAGRRMAAADFAARVDIQDNDEVGELGRVLNSAAERVQELLLAVERESELLRESDAKFRSLSEESLIGIYMIQDSSFVYVNPRFAQIFGYTSPELSANAPMTMLVHPDDRDRISKKIRQQLEGETNVAHYEFRGLNRSGHIVPAEAIGSMGVYRGKPTIIGTLLDLSEQKQAESQIHRLNSSLKKISAHTQILSGQFSDFVRTTLTVWALSKSEQDIAWLLLKGFTFAEIASFRSVQEKTVRQQATAIYTKSGCKNRNELLAYFIQDLLVAEHLPDGDDEPIDITPLRTNKLASNKT